jgi:hypothetical protein
VHSLVYQALSQSAPALLVKHRVNVIDRVAGVIEELRIPLAGIRSECKSAECPRLI